MKFRLNSRLKRLQAEFDRLPLDPPHGSVIRLHDEHLSLNDCIAPQENFKDYVPVLCLSVTDEHDAHIHVTGEKFTCS